MKYRVRDLSVRHGPKWAVQVSGRGYQWNTIADFLTPTAAEHAAASLRWAHVIDRQHWIHDATKESNG